MEGQYQLLVVDDDPDVRELIQDYFSDNGFRVVEAKDATAMRSAIEASVPDVVLLDVGLPGEDGLSLARYLREHHDVGIIMVSGAGETVDRIIGLEVGADDYVTKPFDPRELHARVKCVLRRYQRNGEPQDAADVRTTANKSNGKLCVGDYTLDLNSRQLLGVDEVEIPTTAMEFDLLQVFAERPNRAMSRDQLLSLTQGRDWDPYDRSIDIRIARLRKKIETDPDKPQVIKTVRGVGYMFVPPKH
jgi:DNA-binding response OmpR family regulator